jgi:hypothetical protein
MQNTNILSAVMLDNKISAPFSIPTLPINYSYY